MTSASTPPARTFTWTVQGVDETEPCMSAAGTFTIDWGDGTIQEIKKSDTNYECFYHEYAEPGNYTIAMDGRATRYNSEMDYYNYTDAAFDLYGDDTVVSIGGSLGAIFPTIGDGRTPGTQPRFVETFEGTSITSIPVDLFRGVTGAPIPGMFYETFMDCENLTTIPAGLFSGISGAPAENMFYSTFENCTNLTTIPAGLFSGISGAPAEGMFYETFMDCENLTRIPEGLFSGIHGLPVEGMFDYTFSGCINLTGPSARIDGRYLYEIWPDDDALYFGNGVGCYYNATGLSDYRQIEEAEWN